MHGKDHVNARKKMEGTHHLLQDPNIDFNMFIKTGEERSKVFCYWSTCPYDLFPKPRHYKSRQRGKVGAPFVCISVSLTIISLLFQDELCKMGYSFLQRLLEA